MTRTTSLTHEADYLDAPRQRVSVELPRVEGAAAKRAALHLLWIAPLGLALFAAYLFGVSNLRQARDQSMLLDTFSQQVTTEKLDLPDAPLAPGAPVALLEVPALGIRQVVVEGTGPSQLAEGPGHLPVSPLPGEVGDAVIMGHGSTFGAPLRQIGQLQPGDQIVVTTGQGVFGYEVTGVATTRRDPVPYYAPSIESSLTLVTSASASPLAGRLVVQARLLGDAVGIATRPIATSGDSRMEAAGDTTGWLFAAFWGALFAAAVLTSRRLYRRWTSAAAYLVSAPVLLLLLWFVFENLARVLPGTM
jgi:sortase A